MDYVIVPVLMAFIKIMTCPVRYKTRRSYSFYSSVQYKERCRWYFVEADHVDGNVDMRWYKVPIMDTRCWMT
jgi:hypothetical protein